MTAAYRDTELHINGRWRPAEGGATITIVNPATNEEIGRLAKASQADLDEALAAAEKGFAIWRATPAMDRYKLMRKAAELLRDRTQSVAELMVQEQGKPFAEARIETGAASDVIDWFAEEARRTYGRVIPSRANGIHQFVIKEPVGPVTAFTPWNFPINQAVRKISGSLAAGCSIILKGPEETPASCAALIMAFVDAGLPPGVLNLVWGEPADISAYLIPHPVIRKVTFTGSTVVGKQLAALSGLYMKRSTMELGGHAPTIIFEDADIEAAARLTAAAKYRNAGQVCIAPTRFLVQESVVDNFTDRFIKAADAVKVGDGLSEGTMMGPLANTRRVEAMERMIGDALGKGAQLRAGGERMGNKGNFFRPTVLTDVPQSAIAMNDEPFGPVAIINTFKTMDEVLAEANRLPYGLAAYAYTRSAATVHTLTGALETGMLSVNHHGLALPEAPFGGVKDSGYGSEGGYEAMEAYLNTKFVTHAHN